MKDVYRWFGKIALVVIMVATAGGLAAQDHHVVDGDTIVVYQDDAEIRVRLWGVDAPESDQPHGSEATEYLTQLLSDGFTIVPMDTDRYGRLVAVLYLPNQTQAQTQLISAGYAWWWERYAPRAMHYNDAQTYAQSAQRGLWGEPSPTPPWIWRRQ